MILHDAIRFRTQAVIAQSHVLLLTRDLPAFETHMHPITAQYCIRGLANHNIYLLRPNMCEVSLHRFAS